MVHNAPKRSVGLLETVFDSCFRAAPRFQVVLHNLKRPQAISGAFGRSPQMPETAGGCLTYPS
eukprot:14122455-Alexandrium_andersonii.AAC.1